MVFVYLVHVTHVLRGSQSSKFMIMFYHAREADTESKYSRIPAARAKKSPENAVSAFRHNNNNNNNNNNTVCPFLLTNDVNSSASVPLLGAPVLFSPGSLLP